MKLYHQKINIYDRQINELNKDLETYAKLSSNAKNMFLTIANSISEIKNEFTELSRATLSNTKIQQESILSIKQSYVDVTQHIKDENSKQVKYTKKALNDTFNEIKDSFDKNIAELNLVSKHFKNLGEQIPKALGVSLNELNRGLTSLTIQFKKDYEELLDKHRKGLR